MYNDDDFADILQLKHETIRVVGWEDVKPPLISAFSGWKRQGHDHTQHALVNQPTNQSSRLHSRLHKCCMAPIM